MNSLIIGDPKEQDAGNIDKNENGTSPSAVWLGNRQILPSPTADPVAAATIPSLDAKVTLSRSYHSTLQSPFDPILGIFDFHTDLLKLVPDLV